MSFITNIIHYNILTISQLISFSKILTIFNKIFLAVEFPVIYLCIER